jgi:hypothetical protein
VGSTPTSVTEGVGGVGPALCAGQSPDGAVVQQEDARLARGRSGCNSPRVHCRFRVMGSWSRWDDAGMACRQPGFDSRRVHSVVLWSAIAGAGPNKRPADWGSNRTRGRRPQHDQRNKKEGKSARLIGLVAGCYRGPS